MKLCGFEIGNDKPLFLIAGPCVIESEKIALESAFFLKEVTVRLKVNFIYKTSFEKANRTSMNSYSGPGFTDGLRILRKIKEEVKVPILTDVHEYTPYDEVVAVVDVLQTPAFLCRQTSFIKKVMGQNKPVNIKKGQFLSPWEMKNVVEKASSTGNKQIMVCERGVTFGYNNLVVDMRSLEIMKETHCPVIFDAGHSVQFPGSTGSSSGGKREFIPVLARAATAVGIAGLFLETHPNPERALCDGPNMLPIAKIESLLITLQKIDRAVKTL
ncbi:MAG: 3-deoxy-8-phosphooctulonate synthase [Coxiellaceae bacterium]|jgi:2-dehydro-3-deoxyphosphooctonate aldolase (KDO 8-P synthase)|nr:3-deoxy-8-phosphooctulonate synthase [Coxiellaceae bacterium]